MADREKVIKAFEECLCKGHDFCSKCYQEGPGIGLVCKNNVCFEVLSLLKEQETTFEKDGHHIRCTSCGNYWCDTDSEGDLFPHNYCPHCGKSVKWE